MAQQAKTTEVMVKGKDRHGKAVKIKATGLMAEALEHEVDHLDGKLYIDHIGSTDRLHKVEHPISGIEGAASGQEA